MTNTTYILLKDLPDVKAGAKFKWNKTFGVYTAEGTGAERIESNNWLFINGYPRKYVEDNIEWFEPLELKYSLDDLRNAFEESRRLTFHKDGDVSRTYADFDHY